MPQRAPGYVMVYRSMTDPLDRYWNEKRTFSKWEARIDLIIQARWQPCAYTTTKGTDQLNRGEFVSSLRYLEARWGWDKNTVSRFLGALVKEGFLVRQRKGHTGTVYLVANYDRYQNPAERFGTVIGTANGTEKGHGRDKREEGKEGNFSNGVRTTWLTPYLEAWRAQYGTDFSVEKSSRPLRAVEKEVGAEECLARWRRYLVGTKLIHASAARFAETHTAFAGSSQAQPVTAVPPRTDSDWLKRHGYGVGA